MANTTTETMASPTIPDEQAWYANGWVIALMVAVFMCYVLPFFLYHYYKHLQSKEDNKQHTGEASTSIGDIIWEWVKTTSIEFATSNSEYITKVFYFLKETAFSNIVFILAATIIWAHYVRNEVVANDPKGYEQERTNLAVLHASVTGLLTFLLSMRLNNALAANKMGFDNYCTTCSYLEMFQQRARTHNLREVVYLVRFLPYLIKHEMRGTFSANLLEINHDDDNKPPNGNNNTTQRETFEHYIDGLKESGRTELQAFLIKLEIFRVPGRVCERLEQLILYMLYMEDKWKEKVIMDAWTKYRVASSSIGGSFNYGAPVSFSVVVWLALAVYIYATPYLIPADSSPTQAIVGSTISVLCLLLLHINATRISNPFQSSHTFQTVTEAAKNSTENLKRGVRFIPRNKLKTDSHAGISETSTLLQL